MATYGERLKELREKAGRNQTQTGKLIGKSQNGYAQYEAGTNDTSTEILCKLADLYEVSTDYLLGRTDNPKPPKPAG